MSAAAPTPAQAPRKPGTTAARKEKRQKQIVAVGSVLLLGLLGFQLPKLLGEDQTTVTPGSSTPAPTVEQLAGAPSSLPDTDRIVVQPQSGQLLSFGLFKSKDPFVQQVSTVASPTYETSSPTVTQTSTTPHTPPVRTAPPGGLVPSTTTTPAPVSFPETTATTPIATPSTTPSTTSTPSVPTTTPGTVAISTNGACELVPLKGKFPGSDDIFVVTAIAKDSKSVKIAVTGGAYDSGQATATLRRGRKLTLVNTADGTRYVLKLLPSCDVETAPAPASSSTTTTPSAPSTSTVSTPITPTTTSSSEIIVEDDQDVGEAEDTATTP